MHQYVNRWKAEVVTNRHTVRGIDAGVAVMYVCVCDAERRGNIFAFHLCPERLKVFGCRNKYGVEGTLWCLSKSYHQD